MKIIILSHINGNIDIINDYVKKSNCQAVLCAGDFGIFYQFDNTKHLPSQIEKNKGNFYEYLDGRKKFNVPVYTVYGAHENHSLVDRLINKEISVPNFNILKNGSTVNINGIKVGGVGGTFSPTAYKQEKLTGYRKRHFLESQIEELKKEHCDILIMHDLIGECNAKKIVFSNETYRLFESTMPYYCFVGKYNWLGYQKLPLVKIDQPIKHMAVVILNKAKDSYLVLDTDTWDAEAVSPDLIKLNKDYD